MQFKDYYAILQISRFASNTEIRAAYLMRCKEWHPDKNPGTDTTKKMQDINEAKSILIDPILRANYDYKYNSFKTGPTSQQSNYYADQDTDNARQHRTKRNKLRYEELKSRVDIFKKRDQFLYETYLNQLKINSTQNILQFFENWEDYSLEFIDMAVYETHQKRKYSLDFIYSKIKEKQPKTEPITTESNNERLPWWATLLFWMLLSALIRAAGSK